MKFKLLLLVFSIAFSVSCSAQSIFKPLPKPGGAFVNGRLGLATDSVMNAFRPLVGVTAIVGQTAQLGGGFGIGWEHLKFDQPSQAWVMQYSLSAIAFLGSNGSNATVTAGLVVGFLNLFQMGGGYDFTQKKFVLLTGVGINFN